MTIDPIAARARTWTSRGRTEPAILLERIRPGGSTVRLAPLDYRHARDLADMLHDLADEHEARQRNPQEGTPK